MKNSGKKILFVFLILAALLISFATKKDIPLTEAEYPNINLNIKAQNAAVFVNDRPVEPVLKSQNPYLIYQIKNKGIKKISIKGAAPKEIIAAAGKKVFCYKENEIEKFKNNGEYILPKNIVKASNRGVLKHFTTALLSCLYNLTFLPAILFALAFWLYFHNRNLFALPKAASIWIIAAIGAAFRLADIGSAPFWWDEMYASQMAGNPNYPVISAFLDPGNPPLFFILSKIYLKIVNCNLAGYEGIIRLLPFVFSVSAIFVLYVFIKENLNKKAAIIASALLSINIYSIYSAAEYRAYSLAAFLMVLTAIFLFKTTKKDKNKNFIYYAICSALLANAHWYGVFAVIGNFLWGMFFTKNRLKFFFANLFAGACFLPYFLGAMFVGRALSSSFDAWENCGLLCTLNIFSKLFYDKICTLIVCAATIFIVLKRKNFDKSFLKLYFYLCYFTLFLFLFAGLISWIVKPVIREYYFTVLIPFICANVALLFLMPVKNKILKPVFCIILLFGCFLGGNYIKRNEARAINIDFLLKYAYFENMQNTTVLTPALSYFSTFYKNYIGDFEKITYFPSDVKINELCAHIEKSPKGIYYVKLQGAGLLPFSRFLDGKYRYEYVLGDRDIFIVKVFRP